MSVRRGIPLWGAFALVIAVAAISVPAIGKRSSGMTVATPQERLFSHQRHNESAKADCKRCHTATDDGEWVQKGKKEHARCFSCHKFSSSCGTLARKEGKVCVTCHTTFKDACIPDGYTKPTLGKAEFGASYSHRKHIRPSAKTGEQCEKCHGDFAAGPKTGSLSAGHSLCSGCHARGVTPRIKESCDGCHKKGATQVVVARPANEFGVAGTFDHKAHAAIGRVGTEGRDCLACHENIKESESDQVVPLPTMQSCRAACHDGEKAFDALGTTCTRCHTKGGK